HEKGGGGEGESPGGELEIAPGWVRFVPERRSAAISRRAIRTGWMRAAGSGVCASAFLSCARASALTLRLQFPALPHSWLFPCETGSARPCGMMAGLPEKGRAMLETVDFSLAPL